MGKKIERASKCHSRGKVPVGKPRAVSTSSASTYLKSSRIVRANMKAMQTYVQKWMGTPATRVVPELEELSLFVSEHPKQQAAITQQLRAGHTINVPQFMLTGTQWFKKSMNGYLRIDSHSKWICWPTGCVTAKCGRNTFSNKQIAKASYAKVQKIPHATCARKIRAAAKERKVKRAQKAKELAAKKKVREATIKAMRIKKAKQERANKRSKELQKKRLVIKLEKAAKARLE